MAFHICINYLTVFSLPLLNYLHRCYLVFVFQPKEEILVAEQDFTWKKNTEEKECQFTGIKESGVAYIFQTIFFFWLATQNRLSTRVRMGRRINSPFFFFLNDAAEDRYHIFLRYP